MAQRIMKIQLCSQLGKLRLEEGEVVSPNCTWNSQAPKNVINEQASCREAVEPLSQAHFQQLSSDPGVAEGNEESPPELL